MNRPVAIYRVYRRNFLAALIVALMAAVGLRFFHLQVVKHDRYVTYAENNSIREVRLPAPRGLIYDRHSNFLVTNRHLYSLAVIPAEVEKSLPQLAGLSRYLDITPEEIRQVIQESSGPYQRFQPVTLYENLSFTQRSYLEEHRLEYPGIFFIDTPIRHYPSQARATHLVGYLRSISADNLEQYRKEGYGLGDVVGSAGLERRYEYLLRGHDGYSYHLVDYLLRDLGEIADKPGRRPLPGADLHLSLDVDLQARAELVMQGNLGVFIAMEPNTGEILAYVSSPDYVLAPFTGPIPVALWEQWRDHPDKILLDRSVNGLYPPGSTFKLVAVAAALASGKVNPETEVECLGFYRMGNRTYHCNVYPGHGHVNMKDAVRLSCNIYFYKLIQWIGFDAWVDMALRFGFGKPTGIDLPQESVGLVPTREYMDRKYGSGWTTGHLLNLVLGQGDLLVTPLQITRMTACIANGGTLVVPKVVVGLPATQKPEVLELPQWIWDFMHEAMYEVVQGENGTGRRARLRGATVYGKTGTAENPHGEGHSWFTGWVETGSGPELVVTVLVEHGGYGSRTAAPMAAEVLQYYVDLYHPQREGELAQVH
jgi:penicillin-binding protein 2